MHSRYNSQQKSLNPINQHGQSSYPVTPTNIFNPYQRNQSNSAGATAYTGINFQRNQNQVTLSQQVIRIEATPIIHYNGVLAQYISTK